MSSSIVAESKQAKNKAEERKDRQTMKERGKEKRETKVQTYRNNCHYRWCQRLPALEGQDRSDSGTHTQTHTHGGGLTNTHRHAHSLRFFLSRSQKENSFLNNQRRANGVSLHYIIALLCKLKEKN